MAEIKVGDEVRIFDVNGRRMGQPEDGWPGNVVKVGRKLADIEYGGRTRTFRIDEGRSNDNYGHQFFKTLEQVSLDERFDRATDSLERCGIELIRGHRLTLEQIEALADFARKL
jgi:hypothetical protein